MVRVPDWPMQLSNYLAERRDMPFQWGVNDCLQFVSRGVERVSGVNYYEEYSGYTDEEGAKAMLAKNGGVTGIIEKCLGNGNKNVLLAKRGDVVTVRMPEVTAGLVDDSGQNFVVVTEKGFKRLPLSMAWKVWSY